MNKPISLLDYLKSLLDPRKKAIPLKDILEPLENRAVSSETNIPTGEVFTPVVPGKEIDFDVAEELHRDAKSPVEPQDKPQDEPVPAFSGPIPWRTLAGLFLVLLGQSSFEPPVRELNPGLWFYAVGIVLAIWAFQSGELKIALPKIVSREREDFQVSRRLLWPAFFASLIGFALLFGNLFTYFNLFFWLGGLALTIVGFWRLGEGGALRWRAFLEKIKPPYAFRINTWHVVVLVAALLVLFFRFYRLSEVPAEMFSDHAEKLQDVQDILNGDHHIFFPRNTGREFVQMYLTAFTAKVLGFNLTFMALKMGTALAGLVTLPYIYLLGKELGNRRVGLLATVLAGISYWLNVITRVALRFSLYPLFVAPVLYYLVRGLRRGQRNDFIVAGFFLGLGLNGYSPYRFVPILVVIAVFLFILHIRNRQKVSEASWHLMILVVVSLVVFLPLLRFMTESGSNFSIVMYRSLTRVSNIESEYPGNPVVILADNMWRAMTMFAWDNGNTWVHSVVSRPALDTISAALFYLGYFLLIYRYLTRRKWEDAFLLLAVPFLVLPSAMSIAFPSENPSLNRTSGAIIPVFIIAALALDGIMTSIRRWVSGETGRMAAWGAAVLLLTISCFANYDLVFVQYDKQFKAAAWNTTELGGVIRGFADSIGSEDSAWVIPWPYWVDTRLVGINAGVYIRDYAINRDLLGETLAVAGPKLFLVNTEDFETLAELYRLYPDGLEKRFISKVPGKDFVIFTAPGETGFLP